jgi:hypothetical protein
MLAHVAQQAASCLSNSASGLVFLQRPHSLWPCGVPCGWTQASGWWSLLPCLLYLVATFFLVALSCPIMSMACCALVKGLRQGDRFLKSVLLLAALGALLRFVRPVTVGGMCISWRTQASAGVNLVHGIGWLG